MEQEDIENKIDTMKIYLKDLYEAGVIKPTEYNDIWTKINEIKIHVKHSCEE
jgi:hypothetical protein